MITKPHSDDIDNDLDFVFKKAMECRSKHDTPSFCEACRTAIRETVMLRGLVSFRLDETDICAILRVLDHQHISTEGRSGPRTHEVIGRMIRHIGREKYHEFTAGAWPERLK